jgi:WD40 repeat protein
MWRLFGWGLFVAFLASLTWILGRVLPVEPRCIVGEDFHRIHSALSIDGSRLITTSVVPPKQEGSDIWDTHTGKRLGTLRLASDAVSPDGRFLAGRAIDGSCLITDLRQVRQYPAGGGRLVPRVATFSPQGGYLLVVGQQDPGGKKENAHVFVLDAETGQILQRLGLKDDSERVVGFTPQGDVIFWTPEFKLCEIRRLPSLKLAYKKFLVHLLFSPGNHYLVARDGAAPWPAPWVVGISARAPVVLCSTIKGCHFPVI